MHMVQIFLSVAAVALGATSGVHAQSTRAPILTISDAALMNDMVVVTAPRRSQEIAVPIVSAPVDLRHLTAGLVQSDKRETDREVDSELRIAADLAARR